jgi:hypothetical protein
MEFLVGRKDAFGELSNQAQFLLQLSHAASHGNPRAALQADEMFALSREWGRNAGKMGGAI